MKKILILILILSAVFAVQKSFKLKNIKQTEFWNDQDWDDISDSEFENYQEIVDKIAEEKLFENEVIDEEDVFEVKNVQQSSDNSKLVKILVKNDGDKEYYRFYLDEGNSEYAFTSDENNEEVFDQGSYGKKSVSQKNDKDDDDDDDDEDEEQSALELHKNDFELNAMNKELEKKKAANEIKRQLLEQEELEQQLDGANDDDEEEEEEDEEEEEETPKENMNVKDFISKMNLKQKLQKLAEKGQEDELLDELEKSEEAAELLDEDEVQELLEIAEENNNNEEDEEDSQEEDENEDEEQNGSQEDLIETIVTEVINRLQENNSEEKLAIQGALESYVAEKDLEVQERIDVVKNVLVRIESDPERPDFLEGDVFEIKNYVMTEVEDYLTELREEEENQNTDDEQDQENDSDSNTPCDQELDDFSWDEPDEIEEAIRNATPSKFFLSDSYAQNILKQFSQYLNTFGFEYGVPVRFFRQKVSEQHEIDLAPENFLRYYFIDNRGQELVIKFMNGYVVDYILNDIKGNQLNDVQDCRVQILPLEEFDEEQEEEREEKRLFRFQKKSKLRKIR